MGSAIKRYFPMQIRDHRDNSKGQFKFSNPTPTVAQCANGLVNFKADAVFTRPGISMNRSIGFSVYTKATVTYVPRTAPQLSIVKSATVCPTMIKVHDSAVMQEMKDAAQSQLDYNVQNQRSCFSIHTYVYTYVQKGGRL